MQCWNVTYFYSSIGLSIFFYFLGKINDSKTLLDYLENSHTFSLSSRHADFLETCGSHRTVMLQTYDDLLEFDTLLYIKLTSSILK